VHGLTMYLVIHPPLPRSHEPPTPVPESVKSIKRRGTEGSFQAECSGKAIVHTWHKLCPKNERCRGLAVIVPASLCGQT
jgi:hypothetical protein